jgi:hypothetical protein
VGVCELDSILVNGSRKGAKVAFFFIDGSSAKAATGMLAAIAQRIKK